MIHREVLYEQNTHHLLTPSKLKWQRAKVNIYSNSDEARLINQLICSVSIFYHYFGFLSELAGLLSVAAAAAANSINRS